LTVGCNENIMLLIPKRDKVNPVRVDMGNTGVIGLAILAIMYLEVKDRERKKED